MSHVLPGFEYYIGSLFVGAIGERLNAGEQNFGAASLYIDGRKAAQVSPYGRYQRIPAFGGVADPVRPLLQHLLLNPIKITLAGEAGFQKIGFEIGGWREGNRQRRQRKVFLSCGQEQSQRQISTRRVAGKNQTIGVGALGQQPAIGMERIFKLRGKPMFRCEPVIQGKGSGFRSQCDERNKLVVGLRIVRVSAAVEIQNAPARLFARGSEVLTGKALAVKPASSESWLHDRRNAYL